MVLRQKRESENESIKKTKYAEFPKKFSYPLICTCTPFTPTTFAIGRYLIWKGTKFGTLEPTCTNYILEMLAIVGLDTKNFYFLPSPTQCKIFIWKNILSGKALNSCVLSSVVWLCQKWFSDESIEGISKWAGLHLSSLRFEDNLTNEKYSLLIFC